MCDSCTAAYLAPFLFQKQRRSSETYRYKIGKVFSIKSYAGSVDDGVRVWEVFTTAKANPSLPGDAEMLEGLVVAPTLKFAATLVLEVKWLFRISIESCVSSILRSLLEIKGDALDLNWFWNNMTFSKWHFENRLYSLNSKWQFSRAEPRNCRGTRACDSFARTNEPFVLIIAVTHRVFLSPHALFLSERF